MKFVFVSGRPSLDLAGTRKWRRRETPEEQLGAPEHFAAWTSAAALADAAPAVSASEFDAALALREAVYGVVSARLRDEPPAPDDVKTLNDHASAPPIALTLEADGQVRRRATSSQILATLALDALDLLATDLPRVRECANTDCTRLYVDTSRGRNRRWCGMTECGNRAKVEAFRKRARTPG